MDSLYRICFRKVLSLVECEHGTAPGSAVSSVLKWGQVLPHGIAGELLRALSESKTLTDDLATAYVAGFSRDQLLNGTPSRRTSCLNSISFDNAGALVTDKVLQSLAEHCSDSLEELNLSRCFSFTEGGLVGYLPRFTVLKRLVFSRTSGVANSVLSVLPPTLETVDLTRCQLVSDAGVLSLVARCPKLSSIILFGCSRITDASAAALASLRLENVSFARCPLISDKSLVPIISGGTKETLRSLCLSRCRKLGVDSLARLMVLDSLTTLDLTSVTGFPEAGLIELFARLSTLRIVYLSDCACVTDKVINSLALTSLSANTLERIYLSGQSQLTDDSVGNLLAKCSSLRVINMSKCALVTHKAFSGEIAPSLSSLNLSGCVRLMEETLAVISSLPSLVNLEMANCSGMVRGLSSVASACRSLELLDLSGWKQVDHSSLAIICANCKRLRWLTISDAVVTSDVLDASIPLCSNLELLNLTGCSGVTPSILWHVLTSCRKLIRLDVSRCPGLCVDSTHALDAPHFVVPEAYCGKSFVLESFFVSNNSQLDLCAVVPQIKCMTNLRSLLISGTDVLTDSVVEEIVTACRCLQHLDLADCKSLTDRTVNVIAQHCTSHLTTLVMDGCTLVTDTSVEALARVAKVLCTLNVAKCFHVTDAFIVALMESGVAPSLRELFITGCFLRKKTVVALETKRPEIHVVFSSGAKAQCKKKMKRDEQTD